MCNHTSIFCDCCFILRPQHKQGGCQSSVLCPHHHYETVFKTKNKRCLCFSIVFHRCSFCCASPASVVSSLHGESSLPGEMACFLLSISTEASPPGRLRLLQQPARQVNTQLTTRTRQSLTAARYLSWDNKWDGSVTVILYLSPPPISYPAIKWGSRRCSPRPITGSAPPSRTRRSCPVMCTSSGRCRPFCCPQRPAAGQADAEAARWDLSTCFFWCSTSICCKCDIFSQSAHWKVYHCCSRRKRWTGL